MGIYSDVLLTVDFDRTLTAPDSTIPQRNLDAIRYFMENGGSFTVNTGRSYPMTAYFRDMVPVNAPLLLYNGSARYNMQTRELENVRLIDWEMPAMVKAAMDRFPDLVVEVQGKDAHYLFREDPSWDALCRQTMCAGRHVTLSDDIGPFMKMTIYLPVQETTVAAMYGLTEAENTQLNEALTWLQAQYGEKCEVFRAAPRILDVHAKGVSKLRGARELQQDLGKKILVCVGDGDNDIPMLDGADYAFCPSDALVADRYENVCPCADGAVADVIYEKIPEILKKSLTD